MVYVLFVLFLVLFLIEYKLQKSFVSPFALLLLSFVMAFGLMMFNIKNWEIRLNVMFYLFVFSAVISFFTGTLLVRLVANKMLAGNENNNKPFILDSQNDKYPAVIFLIVSIVCTVVYITMMTNKVGGFRNISGLIKMIYQNKLDDMAGNFFMHQMIEVVVAIAKVNLFELFVLKYLRKGKYKSLTIGLIVVQFAFFLLCSVFSTDRNILMRFVIGMICLWVLFETGCTDKKRTVLSYILPIIGFVMISVFVFFQIGRFRNEDADFGKMISIYGGSGLYDFNLFLLRKPYLQYGESTFLILTNTLKSFGLFGGNSVGGVIYDDFISFQSANGYQFDSNIYSALRPYVEDFGFWGVILYPLIMGMFFELLYSLTKRFKYGFAWLLYSVSVYPIVYFTILEQFFRRLHLGIIYEFGWLIVVYLFAYHIYTVRLPRETYYETGFYQ